MPALALLIAAAAAAHPELQTEGERSGARRTGRYAEAVKLCDAFAAAYPRRARCDRFGVTPEGRPMVALVASADGVLDPAAALAKERPVVLFQGGIHAGEIDGKDAGFRLLRELLDGEAADVPDAKEALAHLTAVFVPVFNADGHERFGRWNRPNQNGPEEMGFRVTAQNLNLNRDYMKAEAPEMRALLSLLSAWDPILYIDLHVTDGAEFQPDVAVAVDPAEAESSPLLQQGRQLRDELVARLSKQKHLPLTFYPSFVRQDEPASGFELAVAPPRFSHSYWSARNRIGLLVETHSWKPYAARVKVTRDTVLGALAVVAREGASWRKSALEADGRALGERVPLSFVPSGKPRTIDFPGYAYTRTPSAVSGALRIKYDRTRPEVWQVPLVDQVQSKLVISPPAGGYLIQAAYAELVAEKLRALGIKFKKLAAARPGLAVESFHASKIALSPVSFEGRQPAVLTGQWTVERRDLPEGSLFVPIAQPRALLVVHLLEPEAPDSLVSWGFFNGALEQKEYMEAYVAEAIGEELLARDPALAAEFAKRLAEPAFARDPAQRLDFFYQRSPSWDERVGLVPIYRVSRAP